MRRLITGTSCTVLLTVALACGVSDAIVTIGGEVDTLTIVSLDVASGNAVLSTLQLEVGDTAVLSAVAFNALDEIVGGSTIMWQSTSPGVAAVVQPGVVVALAPGSTNISASALTTSGKTVTARVPTTVTDESGGGGGGQTAALGTLTIEPASVFLTSLGATAQLTAVVRDSLGAVTTAPLTWRSVNPGIATMNNGRVTAVNYGTTYATVASACCSVDTALITVELTTTGGSTDLDWYCDWSGPAGLDQSIYLGNQSGGPCFSGHTSTSCDDCLSVVQADPAHGFPPDMANVFRIKFEGAGGSSKMVQAHRQWDAPQVGQYIFYRFYEYSDFQPGSQIHSHYFHGGSNAAGSSDYGGGIWDLASQTISGNSKYAQKYGVGFISGGGRGRGYGYFRTDRDSLSTQTLYRREVRIHMTDADSVRHQIRIYNSAGVLIRTGKDFFCSNGGDVGSGVGCVGRGGFARDTVGQYKAYHSGANSFTSLEIGNNGRNPWEPFPAEYMYIGGMAVRVSSNPNDWIGGYPVAGSREGN